MEMSLFATRAVTFLRDVSFRSLLVFALAGLACLALRRASAASRHLLWTASLAALLCLPLLYAALPCWVVPIHAAVTFTPAQPPSAPSHQSSPPPAQPKSTPPSGLTATALPEIPPGPSSSSSVAPFSMPSLPSASIPPPRPIPTPVTAPTRPAHAGAFPTALWLLTAWLLGVVIVTARIVFGVESARRLIGRCRRVTSGSVTEEAVTARDVLGLTRAVSVREGTLAANVPVPMTFGLLRPTVLLPQGAADWPRERLRVVLRHEMGHIRRGDWAAAMLAQIACALYWFHPLVWLAARRLQVEGEEACDDLVLSSGVSAPDYAAQLLEIARTMAARRVATAATVTMAHGPEVAGRLRTILKEDRNQRGVTRRGMAWGLAGGLGLLVPLAAVHPVASASIRLPGGRRGTAGGGAATRTVGKSRWDVALPDGTTLRLMGVAAFDPRNRQKPYGPSRAPNGSPAAWAGPRDGEGLLNASVLVPRSGVPPRYAALLILTRPGRRYSTGEESVIPRADGRFDVVVPLSSGPYRTLVEASAARGARRRLPTGEVVTLSGATPHAPDTAHQGGRLLDVTCVSLTAPPRYLKSYCGYQLMAVGPDGRPVSVPHASSSLPMWQGHGVSLVRFTFRTAELAQRKVTGFRFVCRPVYNALFRDVALWATASATVPPQAAPPFILPARAEFLSVSARGAAGGVQVTKDVSLQLAGVSDRPWDNKRWWRPDGTPFVYDPEVFRTIYRPALSLAFPHGSLAYEFRLTQPSRGTDVDSWWPPERERGAPYAGFSCVDARNGTLLSGSLRAVPDGPNTVALHLRLGAGPWRQGPVRLRPAVGTYGLGPGGGAYEVRRLSAGATQIIVTPPSPGEAMRQETRVVALDRQGRLYLPGPSVTGGLFSGVPRGPSTEYALSAPLSGIKEMVVETRPYRDISVKGVARQPNATPTPQAAGPASLSPPVSLAAFPPAGATPLVQTATWVRTMQCYNASGRRLPGTRPVARFWVRRGPAAFCTFGLPRAGWKTLQDTRDAYTAMTRTAQGNFLRNRVVIGVEQRVSAQIQVLIAPTGHFDYHPTSLGGRAALLGTRTSRSGHEVTREKRWVDPNTSRALRIEQDMTGGLGMGSGRWVLTDSDIRYDESPPPGVFDRPAKSTPAMNGRANFKNKPHEWG